MHLGRRLVRRYHARVIDHYERPRNVGSLDPDDARVGTAIVGAPACGDVMKLQILVEGGRVRDAKFKTFGCGSAIASSSVATEWVKGRTLSECCELTNRDVAEHLKLPPVKLHCSMLAEDAVKAAVANFHEKATEDSK
jgi:Fe-S cluster assembly scaffold IscU